jgi:hypothetical protein
LMPGSAKKENHQKRGNHDIYNSHFELKQK